MPSVKRGDQRAPEIADAAEHHDQEAVDDVALAEIGADVIDLRQRDAGDAGDAGAEPEGQRVDPRGADAHRRRHRAVLRDRPHLEAEPGEAQQAEQADEDRHREDDDPEPPVGDVDLADAERAAHPRRRADLAVGRAERGAHRLLQDQRQAPGRQQGFQRPAVEEADDALLDQDADQAGHHEGKRHRDQERIVEQARTAGADVFLHHEGDIGADHHHLAVRHVDDAHHAEGDGKPDRREQQHRAEREPIPGVLHGGPDRKLVLHRGHRVARGALNRGGRAGRQAGQQVQRVLVAAGADHADGGRACRPRRRRRNRG